MQLSDAAHQIVEAGRYLDARGWAPATAGNYSVRLGGGRVAITVSGRHKGRLTADDVRGIDEEGRPDDSRVPSAEAPLHTSLYQLDSSVGAILHTHSMQSTVIGLLRGSEAAVHLEGYELLKAFPGIETHEATVTVPVFENTQDMPLLAKRVAETWRALPCVGYLIRGHGLYTWGPTMERALRSVEALEFLFACELERRKLGS